MQYTERELAQLISDLETEFTTHLAKAEISADQPASLAKAEDEKPKEDSKEESSKEEAPETEAKESTEEKPEAPEQENEESQPEQNEVPEKAPIADEASGYDEEDIAHLDQMYMSMSKAELLAHHDSCVRALDSMGAEHVHQNPNQPQKEEAPQMEAPQQEVDKCGDMNMGKSENTELELAKSEAIASKAKTEELQKNLDAVQEFLTKLVKQVPQGKAITSLDQVFKSESFKEEKQLSKSEIDTILLKKSADPKLTKNDREAINAFYLNNTNLNTISHLLK